MIECARPSVASSGAGGFPLFFGRDPSSVHQLSRDQTPFYSYILQRKNFPEGSWNCIKPTTNLILLFFAQFSTSAHLPLLKTFCIWSLSASAASVRAMSALSFSVPLSFFLFFESGRISNQARLFYAAPSFAIIELHFKVLKSSAIGVQDCIADLILRT